MPTLLISFCSHEKTKAQLSIVSSRGISTLEYNKVFFKAIMQGRTDYERSALPLSTKGTKEPSGRKNMLPMTIGIKKY